MFQDHAYSMIRSLVAIDAPTHGIVDCSPDHANYFQLPANGGFIPNSAICDEYGFDHTQLLTTLKAAGESPSPTRYLVIRIISRGWRRLSIGSGCSFAPVPAEDRDGVRHDLADSALLSGVRSVDLTGEGQQDAIPGSANLGKVRVIGQTTL